MDSFRETLLPISNLIIHLDNHSTSPLNNASTQHLNNQGNPLSNHTLWEQDPMPLDRISPALVVENKDTTLGIVKR
jgi:hypothetical protein